MQKTQKLSPSYAWCKRSGKNSSILINVCSKIEGKIWTILEISKCLYFYITKTWMYVHRVFKMIGLNCLSVCLYLWVVNDRGAGAYGRTEGRTRMVRVVYFIRGVGVMAYLTTNMTYIQTCVDGLEWNGLCIDWIWVGIVELFCVLALVFSYRFAYLFVCLFLACL